jgi:hypothetical protein
MKNVIYRHSEQFLRKSCPGAGEFGIPVIKRQNIDLKNLQFIGFHNIARKDIMRNLYTLHFFIWDYKFDCVYTDPEGQVPRIKSFKQICSPDYSAFTDMPPWRQMEGIAHGYYCGAYWQKHGITVIPTAAWSDESSFNWCFDGIEKGSVVAVSVHGTKKSKNTFLAGFKILCEVKEPSHVICYGKPFQEMRDYVDVVMIYDEATTLRKKKEMQESGQSELDLFSA